MDVGTVPVLFVGRHVLFVGRRILLVGCVVWLTGVGAKHDSPPVPSSSPFTCGRRPNTPAPERSTPPQASQEVFPQLSSSSYPSALLDGPLLFLLAVNCIHHVSTQHIPVARSCNPWHFSKEIWRITISAI